MSFYLEWLIKKVSGVLPFDMVYGFVGPCFSAVDSSAKTEGNFPPSLSQKRQPSNLCSWFPRKQALFGEHWFPGRRRLGWGPEMSRDGESLKPGRGWLFSGWRGEHTVPRRWWDLEWGIGAGILSRPETLSCSVWEQLPCCVAWWGDSAAAEPTSRPEA